MCRSITIEQDDSEDAEEVSEDDSEASDDEDNDGDEAPNSLGTAGLLMRKPNGVVNDDDEAPAPVRPRVQNVAKPVAAKEQQSKGAQVAKTEKSSQQAPVRGSP